MAMSKNVFGHESSTFETEEEKIRIVELMKNLEKVSHSPDRSSSDNCSTEESSPTTSSSAASMPQNFPPAPAASSLPCFEEFVHLRPQLGTSFSASTVTFDPWATTADLNLEPLLSEAVVRADNSIPLYCRRSRFHQQLGEIQQPAEFMSSPRVNRSYVLTATESPNVAREKMCLHLQPQNFSVNPHSQQTPQNSELSAYAKITHASGYTSFFPLQKLDDTFGSYNCAFVPFFAGKYSASVFESSSSEMAASLNGQLCPSVELEVSRNYFLDSRNPPVAPVSLGENGEKYWGVTVDQFTNRLYISDRSTSDIILFDTVTSTPLYRFGGFDLRLKYTHNELSRPTGLVIDKANKRLIICDKDNHRVSMYSQEGQFISSFGTRGDGPGEFQYPWDVDVSPDGKLIAISDSKNHRVQVFDRFGNYSAQFPDFQQNAYEYVDSPRGVSFSRDGRHIYVTDFNASKLIRIEVESGVMNSVEPHGQFSRLQGLTVDDLGNTMVCDSHKNRLRIFSQTGCQYQTVNAVGWTPISKPVDACIMKDGLVAVLCFNGNIFFV